MASTIGFQSASRRPRYAPAMTTKPRTTAVAEPTCCRFGHWTRRSSSALCRRKVRTRPRCLRAGACSWATSGWRAAAARLLDQHVLGRVVGRALEVVVDELVVVDALGEMGVVVVAQT